MATFDFCDPDRLKKQQNNEPNFKSVSFQEVQKYMYVPGTLALFDEKQEEINVNTLHNICYCQHKKCIKNPQQCNLEFDQSEPNITYEYVTIISVDCDIKILRKDMNTVLCKNSNVHNKTPAFYRYRKLIVPSTHINLAPICKVKFNGITEEVFSLGQGSFFLTSSVVKYMYYINM